MKKSFSCQTQKDRNGISLLLMRLLLHPPVLNSLEKLHSDHHRAISGEALSSQHHLSGNRILDQNQFLINWHHKEDLIVLVGNELLSDF